MEESNIEVKKNYDDFKKEDILEELKKSNIEVEKNWDLFVRAKAEMENIKKRADKEITTITKFSQKNLFMELLPILDSFELCLNNKNENNDKIYEGLQLLYKMLISILNKYNVNKMEINKYTELDPSKHEVISIIKNEEYNNIIESVLQTGYTLHDQVLRYARVSIFKNENTE